MPRKKRKRKGKIISNGVKRIASYLKQQDVEFQTEFRFKDCRDKLPLPFDYIILKDNNIIGLIEYQGIQHYRSVRRFKGKKGLANQQLHDQIKFNYCMKNNLRLLVISYEQEDKIEEILEEFLKFVQD